MATKLTRKLYRSHRWQRLRIAVKHRDKMTCQACKHPAIRPEVDHVKPIYTSGANFFVEFFDIDNLQLLCRNCHMAKTKKEVADWWARNPNHKPNKREPTKEMLAFRKLLTSL